MAVFCSALDVLAYDGWQQDMEEKGFEIISKGGQQAEKAEPEDKGPVSLRKVGDFYEMHGKMRRSVWKSSDCKCTQKRAAYGRFPAEDKDEYSKSSVKQDIPS